MGIKTADNIHLFGIRHHGPSCARSLARVLATLQPDCVLIEGPPEHGLPGLVQLFGIESPGLTSSLALGDEVARRLDL